MSYYRKLPNDGPCWPCPGEAMNELDWRLRHDNERLTRNDQVMAASIISAYRELIALPRVRREVIVRELRLGPNLPKAPHA